MAHSHTVYSEYLTEPLTPASIKRLVKTAIPLLKKYDFDSLAFRGISGALVAPILAFQLNKTLLVVRKPKETGEASHCAARVEGNRDVQRYIIVDDFQASGNTVQAIVTDVHVFAAKAQCIGALFYRNFSCFGDKLLVVRPRVPGVDVLPYIATNPNDFLKKTIKFKKSTQQVATLLTEVKF